MERLSLNTLSLEIISEIASHLDFVDLRRAFEVCRTWYYARPFILRLMIPNQIRWLHGVHGQQFIPREELRSHNAFLQIINRTYTIGRPREETLQVLVDLFIEEMISAWLVPMNEYGAEELINSSQRDMSLYHRRYPLLLRLSLILRWNWAGQRIADGIERWLEMKWEDIRDEEKVQAWLNPNYEIHPRIDDLEPHQTKVLRGLEFLGVYPIVYYGPQDAAAEDPTSRLNAEAWLHRGFDRLKLWLSIPELWNTEIRHEEIQPFLNPYRVYRRIVSRPLLHVILFRAAEYVGFSFQIFAYLRLIELSTPTPPLIRGARYWYEEEYTLSVLHWNFHLFSFPGQYISLFKKPFISLIRGYYRLFGPATLSDFILNLTFFIGRRTIPVRTVVSRTIMRELLIYGYQFLTPEAIDAVVGLIRDAPRGPLQGLPQQSAGEEDYKADSDDEPENSEIQDESQVQSSSQ
jgi:hypothetical protein